MLLSLKMNTISLKIGVIVLLCIQLSHGLPRLLLSSREEILADRAPARILEPFKRFHCCSESQFKYGRDYPVIYCVKGADKSLENLWMTFEVYTSLTPDHYALYSGKNEDEVIDHFLDDQSLLRLHFFFWKPKDIKLNPFNTSCFGIVTEQDYHLELVVEKLNVFKQWMFVAGLSLFLLAPLMAPDPVFYYLTGTVGGIVLSIFFLVFLLVRWSPLKKPAIIALVAGGTSAAMYLMGNIFIYLQGIILQNQTIALGYVVVSGVISFFVCYRYGPPTNQRSINIIKWSLQATGVVGMYSSSHNREHVHAIVLLLLFLYYIPVCQGSFYLAAVMFRVLFWFATIIWKVLMFIIIRRFIQWCKDFAHSFQRTVQAWRDELNPPPRFISEYEYQVQGRVHTERAINDMYQSFHNQGLDNPYEQLLRLSPQSRDRTLNYLANRDNHIPIQQQEQHNAQYNGEITDDED